MKYDDKWHRQSPYAPPRGVRGAPNGEEAQHARGNRTGPLASAVASLAALFWLLTPTQAVGAAERRVTVTKSAPPRVTLVNFAELARREAAAPRRPPTRRAVPFMPTPAKRPPRARATPQTEAAASVRLLPRAPIPLSPALAANFEALGDDGTSIPPDTQGAVGPNHLMVTLNSQVRIQDRSGTALSTVTLEGFWSGTGATGVFDPKVAYDHMSNRWMFCAVSDRSSAAASLLVATSETSDPTGTWDLYRMDADPTDTYWADYPSMGFNKDWIVVTYNAFANADNTFIQADIYAFKKADLYAGTAATNTKFADDGASTTVPATTFDSSLATMYLVQNLIGNTEVEPGVFRGFLEVSTITGSVGSEVYTFGTAYPESSNTWNDAPPGGADFAPQKDSTDKIQAGDSRLLSLVYRNGTLWATHTVFLPADTPATRCSVQWWQFQTDGTIQQFGRIDDETGAMFRAFPSLAVNSQNDVLIGYSTFSGTQYASGSYSFRAGTDSANTMQSEGLLKAGEATYFKDFGTGANRWGDYSNSVVDPVNDLDMWTIQEYAETPVAGEDRWGTWWGKIQVTPVGATRRRSQVTSD